MREALSAMTTRGRGFLAAGTTAALCAILLGQRDLLRIGALLVLLPLVTAFFLGRSRYRLGLVRTVTPAQVAVGQHAKVTLELTNDGKMPTGLLLLEDHVPYVLGTRPRFVVDKMGPRWKRTVTYVLRSDVRGKFTIGPMTVRLSDPFGLVELNRAFQSTTSLVVTPRVTPLPAIPISGAWTGTGDNRPRAFATGSAEDVTVREYRRGDDLRRVHWRSSARVGQLMVRREEQPWQSRATVFLDNRSSSHRGSGAASSLEHAVHIAASVVVHLVQRGFVVRLVTAAGEEPGGSWHEHGALAAETGPLLESLAVVGAVDRPVLDTRWLQDVGHSGLLIAVVGDVGEHDKPAFSRMRHSAASAMAVSLDVQAWARSSAPVPPGTQGASASWLKGHGWKAVTARPGDPVTAVWQDLGVASRGQATTASGRTTDGRVS
ncbi:MAG TPA: DUF58 domain-containing protein [Nocardioidaceae bacterium]|nr:DUF58 domain-containing protein [Nocardioidaceae bacterium]